MDLSVPLDHAGDPRRAADAAAAPEPAGPEPARLIETVKSRL
ncbi:hypothetical protein [Streptomyces sp. NPDC031705]